MIHRQIVDVLKYNYVRKHLGKNQLSEFSRQTSVKRGDISSHNDKARNTACA